MRRRNPIARLRWALLPFIGFYCDGTEHWRWWMRPTRWVWIALGWVPGNSLFGSLPDGYYAVRQCPHG